MGGVPVIGLEQLFGQPVVNHEIKYAEAGLVLACLAGLLNILAILDVYGWGEQNAMRGMSADSSSGRLKAAAKESA